MSKLSVLVNLLMSKCCITITKLWIVWVPGQDIGGRSGSNTLIQGSEPESHWHGPYNNKLMANLINTVIKLSFPLTEVQISVQKKTANVDSSCK